MLNFQAFPDSFLFSRIADILSRDTVDTGQLLKCIVELVGALQRRESEMIRVKTDKGEEWRVSYQKYQNLKGQNLQLQEENRRLRKLVDDYIEKG